MTRKDYVAIASAILYAKTKLTPTAAPSTVLLFVADKIADVMAKDNPRFDRERFLCAALDKCEGYKGRGRP